MNRKNPALPLISMVTPSYNQGEFLEECIDSILSQNYPNLEYVIMDGGSKDNSVEIIKKYQKYLTYWQSRPDDGQYAAIDEGFQKTTGQVMGWLNSDDKLHHQALFKVAYLFTEHPEVEWLSGRTNIWDKNGAVQLVLCEYLPVFTREKYLRKDYGDPSIQQESTFWRRSLWDLAGGGLKKDLQYAGDLELWARFFRHARLYSVDTLLGGFRMYGNQKTSHFMDRYHAEAEAVLEEEQRLFNTGAYPTILGPGAPLVINHQQLREFIDETWRSAPFPLHSLAGNADRAIHYLTSRLQSISVTTHGTRRYLENLEIADHARAEEMSTLIAALNDAVRQPGCGTGNDELVQLGKGISNHWNVVAQDWREKTLLANELKERLVKLTQPEETIKAMLVLCLRKLGLYDYYVRNEPAFSRFYHAARKVFSRF
jgi:hypothetical protein